MDVFATAAQAMQSVFNEDADNFSPRYNALRHCH